MYDFWENLIRFPRFFVSSSLGLILIILNPLLNLTRKPETIIILIITLGVVIFLLFTILKTMLELDIQ